MLKSSQCSVFFPVNGLSLESDITFQPGITAVVGKNGTGKTFKTIELWRYLLFGKKALRGPASDYKNLKAEGVVEIKGVDYRISRTPKTEGVYRDDEQIAVGTDAVNKKIIELLGFGLDVFDITNASVQKQSSRLTQLTPAKRKELIDEVCGLSQNEKVEKDCKDKSKMLRLEADTIRENIVEPQKPVRPDGYKASSDLKTQLAEAREIEHERAHLQRVIEQKFPLLREPKATRADVDELERHERDRLRTDTERQSLQRQFDAIPTTTLTEKQIKDGQTWVQYDSEIARRGPRPKITRDEATSGVRDWQKHEIQTQIQTQVQCPKCLHSWVPQDIAPPPPEEPLAYYTEQLNCHDRWATELTEPKGTRVETSELREAHTAFARRTDRQQLAEQLNLLDQLKDFSSQLDDARALELEWNRYEAGRAALKEALAEQMEAHKRLAELPPEVDVAALDAAFVNARIFEEQNDRYKRDVAGFARKITKTKELTEEAGEFTKGAQKLAEARKEVKAHLAPAISRIASSLIMEMTCGKLSTVAVDDDMNITVDGQEAATLSGAGETAANLAIRLALGRTLVAGVFPVFLGDEIDADADEERSEAMFECLKNLASQFAQVIIITHKPHVMADHTFDFDE